MIRPKESPTWLKSLKYLLRNTHISIQELHYLSKKTFPKWRPSELHEFWLIKWPHLNLSQVKVIKRFPLIFPRFTSVKNDSGKIQADERDSRTFRCTLTCLFWNTGNLLQSANHLSHAPTKTELPCMYSSKESNEARSNYQNYNNR